MTGQFVKRFDPKLTDREYVMCNKVFIKIARKNAIKTWLLPKDEKKDNQTRDQYLY